MNEEICCITKKRKTAKTEWENYESDFHWALYSVFNKRIRTILFPYLPNNLFKQRYISFGKHYKYLNKLTSQSS